MRNLKSALNKKVQSQISPKAGVRDPKIRNKPHCCFCNGTEDNDINENECLDQFCGIWREGPCPKGYCCVDEKEKPTTSIENCYEIGGIWSTRPCTVVEDNTKISQLTSSFTMKNLKEALNKKVQSQISPTSLNLPVGCCPVKGGPADIEGYNGCIMSRAGECGPNHYQVCTADKFGKGCCEPGMCSTSDNQQAGVRNTEMNLKKSINKIVALDIESDCADALERVAEALREFGYCGEGTDLCSEIQRAISEYNTRWDSCVKPWAKECGREDTNNNLGEIPFWYGPGTWWGCVRGSMLQEKKSKCSIEVLDEIFAMSRAFIGVKDDIFTINTDICPNCFLDLGERVMPQVVIPDVLKLGTLPENIEMPGKEVMGSSSSCDCGRLTKAQDKKRKDMMKKCRDNGGTAEWVKPTSGWCEDDCTGDCFGEVICTTTDSPSGTARTIRTPCQRRVLPKPAGAALDQAKLPRDDTDRACCIFYENGERECLDIPEVMCGQMYLRKDVKSTGFMPNKGCNSDGSCPKIGPTTKARSINLKEALSKVTRAAEYGPGRTPLNSRYEACLAQADDAAAVCGSNCPGGGHGADDMECLRQCYCNRCDNKYKCRVKTYAPNGGVIPQGWIDEASACRAEYGCQGGDGPELESKGLPGIDPIGL